MNKVITLTEIATLANTSIATVSRVLNNPDYRCADKQLQQRIVDIAKEYNYKPNQDAKNLKRSVEEKINKKISLYFARTKSPGTDYFFSAVARAVEEEALIQGCSLGFSYNELETLDVYKGVDPKDNDDTALIVIGRPLNPEISKTLIKSYKNLVFTGLQSFFDESDQVICNGYIAAKTALSHLQSLNHTNIAYMGETKNEIRYSGYIDFFTENNLPLNTDLIFECDLSYEGGRNGALKLLNSNKLPTAIFCANDITALGVQSVLLDRKINIPDDMSIISIDNIELAEFSKPLLTTIDVPAKELGRYAVKLAISRLNNEHSRAVKISLPCKLISRESCRARKHR